MILDPDHVQRSTGVTLDTWVELVSTMKRARYGAILHDPASHPLSEIEDTSRAILELVTELNDHVCFVYCPLGQGENAAGVEQVVAWKTALSGIDRFSREIPEVIHHEETTEGILRDRAIDAALLISNDPLASSSHLCGNGLGMCQPSCCRP